MSHSEMNRFAKNKAIIGSGSTSHNHDAAHIGKVHTQGGQNPAHSQTPNLSPVHSRPPAAGPKPRSAKC